MRTTTYADDLSRDIRNLILRAEAMGYDPKDIAQNGTSTIVMGMNHWARMICVLWEDNHDPEKRARRMPVIRNGEVEYRGLQVQTMPGTADNAMWIQDRNGKVVTW